MKYTITKLGVSKGTAEVDQLPLKQMHHLILERLPNTMQDTIFKSTSLDLKTLEATFGLVVDCLVLYYMEILC